MPSGAGPRSPRRRRRRRPHVARTSARANRRPSCSTAIAPDPAAISLRKDWPETEGRARSLVSCASTIRTAAKARQRSPPTLSDCRAGQRGAIPSRNRALRRGRMTSRRNANPPRLHRLRRSRRNQARPVTNRPPQHARSEGVRPPLRPPRRRQRRRRKHRRPNRLWRRRRSPPLLRRWSRPNRPSRRSRNGTFSTSFESHSLTVGCQPYPERPERGLQPLFSALFPPLFSLFSSSSEAWTPGSKKASAVASASAFSCSSSVRCTVMSSPRASRSASSALRAT
jgi:hypothetical protein